MENQTIWVFLWGSIEEFRGAMPTVIELLCATQQFES